MDTPEEEFGGGFARGLCLPMGWKFQGRGPGPEQGLRKALGPLGPEGYCYRVLWVRFGTNGQGSEEKEEGPWVRQTPIANIQY